MNLLADSVRSDLRWHHLPPAWVVVLLIVPLVALAAWWAYRRETEVPRPARFLLATLRGLAIALFLVVLFGPYSELSDIRTVRSNLVVVLDQSQSMGTVDSYEPDDARKLAAAAGVPQAEVSTLTRLELAKKVLANPATNLLEDWTRDFRVHVFSFGTQTTPLVSTGDPAAADAPETEEPAALVRRRLPEIQATDPATRIGQAVATVCDTFRLRDEVVGGVVVISDGQENGTVVSPSQAGRKAAAAHVPVFAVGVGDPRSPKNIHVGNLRAKEVVLAKDDTAFEFSVHAKGFEDRRVRIEMFQKDAATGRTRPLTVTPSDVVLEGGDKDQQVKVIHRFLEPGTVTVRVGVPVQPEEKIQSDNYAEHTLRVIDRKIKVLYVEDTPRWEFLYLSNALIRDRETILAHTLLVDADPETPQKKTSSPDWPPLDASLGFPSREKLFDYDVVILGDVDPRKSLAPDEEKAQQALVNLRDFVEKGGGLILLSGVRNNPTRYKDTELQGLLPILVDRSAERADPPVDTTQGFNLIVTPDGAESPLMNVAGDAKLSKDFWERDRWFRQYWCYPALRAKTLAKVLAVSGSPAHDDPRYGRRPAIATMLYGRGRVLWLGIDELWRIRKETADRYFYTFYSGAIRFLATYRLLGGNKRFKILTEKEQYGVDEPVRVTLVVSDRDYEPSKAKEQTVTVVMPPGPDGQPESVDLTVPADPSEAGTYRRTILPTRAGEYRIKAAPDDPKDEAPEKIFRVVESTVEGRDLLLDEARLTDMASLSEGGAYLLLGDLPTLRPPPRSTPVRTDQRDDEVWDDAWTLALATSLLAAEWLLRKRWHLV